MNIRCGGVVLAFALMAFSGCTITPPEPDGVVKTADDARAIADQLCGDFVHHKKIWHAIFQDHQWIVYAGAAPILIAIDAKTGKVVQRCSKLE